MRRRQAETDASTQEIPSVASNAAVPRNPDAPHWIPAGNRWNEMPEKIRQAVSRILAPAYRRFVLDAPGELERSIGLTLVHLMWLEVCDQVKMAVVGADPNSLDAVLSSPENMIDRHLRLTTVKCQTAELLMKLRMLGEMLQARRPLGQVVNLPWRPAGRPGGRHCHPMSPRTPRFSRTPKVTREQVANLLHGGV